MFQVLDFLEKIFFSTICRCGQKKVRRLKKKLRFVDNFTRTEIFMIDHDGPLTIEQFAARSRNIIARFDDKFRHLYVN